MMRSQDLTVGDPLAGLLARHAYCDELQSMMRANTEGSTIEQYNAGSALNTTA